MFVMHPTDMVTIMNSLYVTVVVMQVRLFTKLIRIGKGVMMKITSLPAHNRFLHIAHLLSCTFQLLRPYLPL